MLRRYSGIHLPSREDWQETIKCCFRVSITNVQFLVLGPSLVQTNKNNEEREDCNNVWQNKVVILHLGNTKKTKVEVKRWEWATAAAIKFYSTSFNSTEADLSCIKCAGTCDPSIMIVGRPLGEGEDLLKTIIQCPDSVVISCITFRNGTGDDTGSSLVHWLLVAESESSNPSFIASWRRQGFGRLMLIMLIKMSFFSLLSHAELLHCTTRLLGVDVYLQCPHKEPMAF
jgi:hypothetical protein